MIYSILFYSIPFYFIQFYSIPFHSVPFRSVPFHSIPFYYILLNSIQLHYIMLQYIPFYSIVKVNYTIWCYVRLYNIILNYNKHILNYIKLYIIGGAQTDGGRRADDGPGLRDGAQAVCAQQEILTGSVVLQLTGCCYLSVFIIIVIIIEIVIVII